MPDNSQIADAILDAVATRSDGLGTILKDINNIHSTEIVPSTFYRWLQADDELRNRYARARADQAQLMAEQIAEIADNTQVGEIVTVPANGSREIKYADMLEHRKLRIEARKWLAAKLLPKVYGDKIQQTHSDPDGNPLHFVVKSILDKE